MSEEEIFKLYKNQQKEIEEKNIAINKMSRDISRQLEEIEEKSTIIMAGAEKVKELEKGNRSLMESRIKWKNRYYKEKEKNTQLTNYLNDSYYVSADKIREKIEELESFDKAMHQKNGQFTILVLKGLLNDGDHIPRID